MKPSLLLRAGSLSLLAFAATVCGAYAQSTILWDAGGGANKNWSTTSNWNPNGTADGNYIQFVDAGKGNSTTVGNIVDQNTTIESLTYRQTINNTATPPAISDYSANWQVMNINTGVTLTLNAAGTAPTNILMVGRDESGPFVTNAKIQGEGSMVIEETGSNIWVNNPTNSSSIVGYSVLDMSGLGSFSANVNNVEVGTRGTSNAKSLGLLALAADNTVTANAVIVGSTEGVANGTGTTLTSSLQLGRTNDLNVDNMYIGAASGAVQNRSSGEMKFQTFGSGPTPEVVIRAKDGTGRANLIVGKTGASSGTTIAGTVDFTGGTVDALLNDLFIGVSTTAVVTGSLSMDEGSIDATTVRLGYTNTGGGSTGQLTGNLNVSGGTFLAGSMILAASQGTNNQPVTGNLNVSGTGAVTITNNLTMGNWGSSSFVGALIANVSITGGSLTVNGNIAEGTGPGQLTSNLTLNGGMLDMTGGTITNLTNFNLQSGTLKDLAQFNAGAAVTKSTSGTVTYEGTNAYTGATTVSLGTLLVNGSLTSSAVTVQSGGTLGGSGTLGQSVTVQSGGNLAPGTSPGSLTVGGVNLQSGADLTMELAGATSGTSYDQLVVNGTVNLNSDSGVGADLLMTLSYAPSIAQTFTLISNDGVDAITGSFATINGVAFGPGNTFNLTYNSATYGFQLSYTGGTGNDLVASVTAIPEPSTWLLLALGLTVVVTLRRRSTVE